MMLVSMFCGHQPRSDAHQTTHPVAASTNAPFNTARARRRKPHTFSRMKDVIIVFKPT